jgi:hypothetical protein
MKRVHLMNQTKGLRLALGPTSLAVMMLVLAAPATASTDAYHATFVEIAGDPVSRAEAPLSANSATSRTSASSSTRAGPIATYVRSHSMTATRS